MTSLVFAVTVAEVQPRRTTMAKGHVQQGNENKPKLTTKEKKQKKKEKAEKKALK